AAATRKPGGNGKALPASVAETTGRRQKSSPSAKPKSPAVEAKKQDGKSKTESAHAGETTGRQKPLPASKPKTPAAEAKKQDGQGKAEATRPSETTGKQKA